MSPSFGEPMSVGGSSRVVLFCGLASISFGCADIAPIEDGRSYGEVVTLKDWFTSSYLLSYSEGAVLFDAGFRAGKMAKLLASQGVEADTVTHVFVTHGHGDHIGALGLFPNAEVYGMEAERALIEGESDGAHTLDVGLFGGEEFVFDDVTIEAISVPGHTPGNAVYRVGNTVLLGDSALVTRDGRLTPVAEKRSDDPTLAAESLTALAAEFGDQPIDWLVPAHSAGLPGLDALLEYAERE